MIDVTTVMEHEFPGIDPTTSLLKVLQVKETPGGTEELWSFWMGRLGLRYQPGIPTVPPALWGPLSCFLSPENCLRFLRSIPCWPKEFEIWSCTAVNPGYADKVRRNLYTRPLTSAVHYSSLPLGTVLADQLTIHRRLYHYEPGLSLPDIPWPPSATEDPT